MVKWELSCKTINEKSSSLVLVRNKKLKKSDLKIEGVLVLRVLLAGNILNQNLFRNF